MPDFTWPTGGGHGFSTAADEARDRAFQGRGAKGASVSANGNRDQGVTHRLRVAPSRSMKAISGEVEALLDGMEESSRRSCGLLASELIAQVTGRAPGFDGEPVGLTVQLREDAVRLEATGPVAPSVLATADHDAVPVDPFTRSLLTRLLIGAVHHRRAGRPLGHRRRRSAEYLGRDRGAGLGAATESDGPCSRGQHRGGLPPCSTTAPLLARVREAASGVFDCRDEAHVAPPHPD
jgi:hypothetical protein